MMHIDFLNVLNSSSLLFLKLALQLPAPLQPVQLPPKLGSEQEGECCVSPVVVLPRHEPGQLLALVWVAAAAPGGGWAALPASSHMGSLGQLPTKTCDGPSFVRFGLFR